MGARAKSQCLRRNIDEINQWPVLDCLTTRMTLGNGPEFGDQWPTLLSVQARKRQNIQLLSFSVAVAASWWAVRILIHAVLEGDGACGNLAWAYTSWSHRSGSSAEKRQSPRLHPGGSLSPSRLCVCGSRSSHPSVEDYLLGISGGTRARLLSWRMDSQVCRHICSQEHLWYAFPTLCDKTLVRLSCRGPVWGRPVGRVSVWGYVPIAPHAQI